MEFTYEDVTGKTFPADRLNVYTKGDGNIADVIRFFELLKKANETEKTKKIEFKKAEQTNWDNDLIWYETNKHKFYVNRLYRNDENIGCSISAESAKGNRIVGSYKFTIDIPDEWFEMLWSRKIPVGKFNIEVEI